MYMQDRPTSLPAPKGVRISWSSSLVTNESRLLRDGCGPVEAISLFFTKNAHKSFNQTAN